MSCDRCNGDGYISRLRIEDIRENDSLAFVFRAVVEHRVCPCGAPITDTAEEVRSMDKAALRSIRWPRPPFF